MILIFIILGLIISILVLIIRYFKAYARLTSHKTFDQAARKKMKDLVYEDPKITCDYCGTMIDTRIDRVCPHCGAEYANDSEWLARHKIDQEWVDDKAEAQAELEIAKTQAEASAIARKIRRRILILVTFLLLLIIIVTVATREVVHPRYAKDEELNEYSFDHYEKMDYDIIGDGLLIENEKVKVEVTGIYQDTERKTIKIGYHLVNNCDKPVRFSVRGVGINNYGKEFNFIYENLRKNSEVTIYESVYDIETIESMVYGRIEVIDEEYNTIIEQNKMVTIQTTNPNHTDPEFAEGTILFENDFVVINGLGFNEEDEYKFQVLNKTDYNLQLECKECTIGSESIEVYGCSAKDIPSGYLLENGYFYSREDAYVERKSSQKVSVNFRFKDLSSPEHDFSTGYFEVK